MYHPFRFLLLRVIIAIALLWLLSACKKPEPPHTYLELFEYSSPPFTNGDVICFTSDRAGNLDLYQMTPSGEEISQLTDHPEADYSGRWRPEGLLFRSSRSTEKRADFFFLTWPEGEVSDRPEKKYFQDLNVSPGQKYRAYSSVVKGQPDLFLENQIDKSTIRISNDTCYEWARHWSADGRFLLFLARNDKDAPFPQVTTELYLYDVVSERRIRLTNNDLWDGEAQWSPDNTAIVYTRIEQGQTDIVLITDTAASPTVIAPSAGIDRNPIFSPDGQYILFESNRSGNYEIYRYQRTTKRLVRLTRHPAKDVAPAWRPAYEGKKPI